MGRVNAEGFLGFWPTVIGADGADPRDEAFAKWLVETDKVVFSSTLREAPWERTALVDRPIAEAIADLKAGEGDDIFVLSSASVIKALLTADMVDRLALRPTRSRTSRTPAPAAAPARIHRSSAR